MASEDVKEIRINKIFSKIELDNAYTSAEKRKIIEAIEDSYFNSSTAEIMLNDLIFGRKRTYHIHKFDGLMAEVGGTNLRIGTDYLNNLREINEFGKIVEKIDFRVALMHEFSHAIGKLRDRNAETVSKGDYLGDNVRLENRIRTDFGIAERISYDNVISEKLALQFKKGFTEGNRVDLVVAEGGKKDNPYQQEIDTSAIGSSRDLLIDKVGLDSNYKSGAGNDWIYGMGGKDKLNAGAGSDHVFGDLGHDTIMGGAGSDTLSGGDGSDLIYSGSFNNDHRDKAINYLDGGVGDDTLYGAYGSDSILGQQGNDTASGGNGNDYMYGDYWGYDNYDLSASSRIKIWGFSKEAVDSGTTKYGVREHISLLDWEFGYLFRTDGRWKNQISENGVEYLERDSGNDILYGGSGEDYLYGSSGNDRLYGDDDKDRMIGGMGNDTLYGGAGDDRLAGGPGEDVLIGGEGVNRYFDLDGKDSIRGGDGKGYDVLVTAVKDYVIDPRKNDIIEEYVYVGSQKSSWEYFPTFDKQPHFDFGGAGGTLTINYNAKVSDEPPEYTRANFYFGNGKDVVVFDIQTALRGSGNEFHAYFGIFDPSKDRVDISDILAQGSSSYAAPRVEWFSETGDDVLNSLRIIYAGDPETSGDDWSFWVGEFHTASANGAVPLAGSDSFLIM